MKHAKNKFKVILILSSLIIIIARVTTSAETKIHLNVGDRVRVKISADNNQQESKLHYYMKHGIYSGVENGNFLISSKGDIQLNHVIKNDGSNVVYPFVGAQYDSLTQSIIGINKSGKIDSVHISDVEYVDVVMFINSKQIHTKIYSHTIHNRLRFIKSYPQISDKIPVDSIMQIQKWKMRNNSTTAISAIAGGSIGFFMGYQTAEDDKPSGEWLDLSPKISRETKIIFFTVSGLIAGGIFGRIIGQSSWQKVPLENLNITLEPNYKGGLGLSLAVRF